MLVDKLGPQLRNVVSSSICYIIVRTTTIIIIIMDAESFVIIT